MDGGETPQTSRWQRLAREIAPFLVVFLVGGKASYDNWRSRDLTATDETWYMSLAWQMSDPNAAPAKNNPLYVPLYVEWYRLLTRLPVELEYLPFVSHAVWMVLLGCLFYALLRRLDVGRLVSVLATTVLIHCTKLAAVEPFPVHAATALLALGVWLGTFQRSLLGACGPIGFAALVACYLRNEFGTFLLVFLPGYLGAGTWCLWRGADCRRDFLPWAIPLVCAVGACATTFGFPMPDGPRSSMAFMQHYARNVTESRGGDATEWSVYHVRTAQADFGEVQTAGECVRARPDLVAWHVKRNIQQCPDALRNLCQFRVLWKPFLQQPAEILLLAVLGVGLVRFLRRMWLGGLREPDKHPVRVVLLALACVALISGPSVVVVYPREHYLLLPLFFILALAVSGLPAPQWPTAWLGQPTPWKVWPLGVFVTAFVLAGTPTATDKGTILRPLIWPWRHLAAGEGRDIMALLRELPRRPGTVVMEYKGSSNLLTVWMAQPVLCVPHELKTEGFREFVAKYKIQVVILHDHLLKEPVFAADPEFMALWNETDTGEFVVLAYRTARIAVRRELVPPE